MSRSGAYLLGGGLGVLAFAAMGWAAMPPDQGLGLEVVDRIKAASRDALAWYQGRPLDGAPDWEDAAQDIQSGDADLGRTLILEYGCGACHDIPGIAEAKGRVGPSLHGLADRAYIGGVLPNMPGGLVRWIVDPTTHAPLTAMPDLGVTPNEAQDIAAYLYLVGER